MLSTQVRSLDQASGGKSSRTMIRALHNNNTKRAQEERKSERAEHNKETLGLITVARVRGK